MGQQNRHAESSNQSEAQSKAKGNDEVRSEEIYSNAGFSGRRLRQHKQWMQVMMEGQSTPDLRYQTKN